MYRFTADNEVYTDVTGKVVVPHDSSGKEPVEDEGSGYSVTPECGEGE